LTFFEVLNAAFWLWVRDHQPDYVLLETGLGGRLDTTTVCNPTLKILTQLERDHIALLGKTMNQIAWEKTEAMRVGIPTIVARQSEWLLPRIQSTLQEKGIPARYSQLLYSSQIVKRECSGWTIRIAQDQTDLGTYQLGLAGDHQIDNFLSAFTAWQDLGFALPKSPADDPILISPHWPGRCQVLKTGDQRSWALDGSHTASAGQAFRQVLDQIIPPEQPRQYSVLCSRDRYLWCYLRGLLRRGDRVRIVNWKHPRVWEAQELRSRMLADGWAAYDLPDLEIVDSEEVFNSPSAEALEIVCGSLYWVGEGLRHLVGQVDHPTRCTE
jgi:dihydrofolate synthase/folylpolyglutamate synthase